jgi:hypothetical protein
MELSLPNIHFSFSLLFKMNSVSNWHHSRPKKYFPRCIELFGQPTFVANVRHGYALWKTKGLFTQHLLIDEDVKHCVPRPHHDYFYSSVKFYIPPKKVCDVLKISGSINYDGLKKELTARCGGIGANYATIYLGMLVASGKLSLSQVKSKDMYPRMIRGEIIPHKEMAKKMMQLKRENNKKYSKELGLEYATYAYDKCYTKKKRTTKNKTRKMKGGGLNTRYQSCNPFLQNCCPHMGPDQGGHYRATNETNELTYQGVTYLLKTCCQMCADAMKKELRENPAQFEIDYKPELKTRGSRTYLMLSNKVTGKPIQALPPK